MLKLFLKNESSLTVLEKEFSEMTPCIGLKSRIKTDRWLDQMSCLALNSEP